ncbi:MAG: phenylacetate--CoA ligase [Candidatus Margulisiibacteriota bacterium]
MIWEERVECAEAGALKDLQSRNLKETVRYVNENSPFYRKRFDELGVKPGSINDISDITRLPFTTKEDLRDNYPFGLFSVPLRSLAEIHVSSGTTGNPTVVGYTKDDLKLWSKVVARALCCAGANPGDLIQVAYGYGLFTGGLGLHYGALEMGLVVIPASSGQTKRQLKLMEDFKPRILASTPSYALYMAEEAAEMGMDTGKSSWEIGVFGAEPWSESIRKDLEASWKMTALDIYGLSEIIGPGVAQECSYKAGLHVFSDLFYPEVIDSATGREAKEGDSGELVITTLTKKGIPLIRYRTRDIVSIDHKKCRCGRTLPRISKIKGRTDDMIIVRGINIFPSQIEHVLLSIEGVKPQYQIVVDRGQGKLDEIEIHVEVDQKIFSDEIKKMNILEEKIRKEMASVLGIFARVKLVEPRSLARSEGKASRVIDKRKT